MTSAAAAGSPTLVLIFRVAGLSIAVRCRSIREIVFLAATVDSPGPSSPLTGFLNVHGEAVPVIALSRLFRVADAELGIHTPLILLQCQGRSIGLIADHVDEVAAVQHEALQLLAADHSLNDCAEAQFTIEGRGTVLLDSERLLLKEESERLQRLAEDAQRRLESFEAAIE